MPEMILSSVLFPDPLRPMMPTVSPCFTSKLTASRTVRRRKLRGRKSPNTCSRTVSRRTSGKENVLLTASTWIMRSLQVFGRAGREAPEYERPDSEDDRRDRDQIKIGLQGRNDV